MFDMECSKKELESFMIVLTEYLIFHSSNALIQRAFASLPQMNNTGFALKS